MKKGKYYKVYDTNDDFWMIGICNAEPDKDPIRCFATFITSNEIFTSNGGWCFRDVRRNYRLASDTEIKWLKECIIASKFIPFDKIELTAEYEIY